MSLDRLRPGELIALKREGGELTADQLDAMVTGMLAGGVSEAQMAALLMAGVINGFTTREATALTRILWRSGASLDLSSLSGPTLDKHSTGGVGDGTTLIVAPLVAAAGGQMVKLSGRGLGHTGGTLDKLESIPGFTVELSPARMLEIAEEVGCVVAAQTDRLVPADRELYALRDVTGTVDSPALIASSVMSKKLASGASTIVLDVKAGDGAFMRDTGDAEALARLCVELGQDAGRRCAALVTDMDQPLGRGIGNALEVAEAVELLARPPQGRLAEVALELAAVAMAEANVRTSAGEGERQRAGGRGSAGEGERQRAGGRGPVVARDVAAVREELRRCWEAGEALERLERMIAAQGGDPRVCADPSGVLPAAPVTREVLTTVGGRVRAVPARRIGEIVARLGAGRARKGDDVDPAVGVRLEVEVGDELSVGQRIAVVSARTAEDAETAVRAVAAALELGDDAPARDVILSRVLLG